MARKKKKNDTMIQAYAGITVVFSLIVMMHESTGFLGQFFYQLSRFVFGDLYYILYIIAILFGLVVFVTASINAFVSFILIEYIELSRVFQRIPLCGFIATI